MSELNAIHRNFINLNDDPSNSIILRALSESIILSGNEGIQKFIDDHTSRIVDPEDRHRAVSMLSGIFARRKQDLQNKRKATI